MSKSRFFKKNCQYFDWKKSLARNEILRHRPRPITDAIHSVTHGESPLKPGLMTTLLLFNLVLADSANSRKIESTISRPEETSPKETSKAVCYADSKLPAGCEDFKLVRGDVSQAKTFILGEAHRTCDKARFKCMRALSQERNSNKSVMMFESLPHNKYIDCTGPHMGTWNWYSIGTTCKGWNKPDKGVDVINLAQTKSYVLKGFADGVQNNFLNNGVYSLTYKEQTRSATEILTAIKNKLKARLSKYTASHQELYDIFKVKNPKIPIEQFHSTDNQEMMEVTFLVEFINELITKIKKNQLSAQSVLHHIEDEINKLDDVTMHLSSNIYHHANHTVFSNRFLITSIKEAAKEHDYIYVTVGKAHVINFKEETIGEMSIPIYEVQKKTIEEYFKTQEKIVSDFNAALDESAEELPSAVLTCTLRP